MSFTEIFGTKAFWVFVALLFIGNIIAFFSLNGFREYMFLLVFDAIALIAHVVAVWLGSQKIQW
jgi:hypothetical protein